MKRILLKVKVLLVCSLLLAVSCKDSEDVKGKYMAETRKDQQAVSVKLELGANGQGSWVAEEERIPFKWEKKGREIWLHTKAGGVMVGNLKGGEIEMTLPGIGILFFKKIPGK